MSAWEHLSQTQFKHEFWDRWSKGSHIQGLQVTAEHPKFGRVGQMDLSVDPDDTGHREIMDMGVVFKRKGIGTGMYRYAEQAGLNPRHSPMRTDEGDAWANAVGGDVPTRNDWRPKA